MNVGHGAADAPIYLCADQTIGHGPFSVHRGPANVFYRDLFANGSDRLDRVNLAEIARLGHENHAVVNDDPFSENRDCHVFSVWVQL